MLAILLAAGRGRRLGQAKTLVDLGGRPALARCLDALREGGCDDVRVVLGPDADAARAAVDLSGVACVVNPDPDTGQTASLKRALADGPGDDDGFLLHTVDHPLVEARDVRVLREAWRARAPGTAIVVPSVDGHRGHPALFARALAQEFVALGDDQPAHRVVRADAARVQHVVMDRPWLVRDIDTPEDLEAARAALAQAPR